MATNLSHNRSLLARPIDEPLRQSGTWSLDEGYRYCENLARSHYENFPVASIVLPRHLRRHVCAIYAFARTADDFADEGYDRGIGESERQALLDEWRGMLEEAFSGSATHPVFLALADTRAKFQLPPSLFEDLLSAFRQDVTRRRYESFDELLDYCRRSANPIGRLLLLLFGYRDERLHLLSDCICSALQLANHWQDVEVDLRKDRVYLPENDLRHFGLDVASLGQKSDTPEFRNLMKVEVDRARELFARGKPLCTALPGRLGLELRLIWLGGMAILRSIEASGYDVFRRRPVIGRREQTRIFLTALNKEAFRRL